MPGTSIEVSTVFTSVLQLENIHIIATYKVMASSVPGYEYDVFISYRQKDNKYDGWVTEFAASLRNEIEATFTGQVGIYFDENPHDGLRESHDSLRKPFRIIRKPFVEEF